MLIAVLFATLFALLAIGTPIAIALGLSSALTILLFTNETSASLALKLFTTMNHYTLLAIPFFFLSGALMTSGGIAKRMVQFTVACVGHIRGGLAIAGVLSCMLFAAVSGSSPATVVAIGSIVIASLVQAGYSRAFAAGLICTAGTLGIMVPPSIPMIVYAAVTETSVARLFMAGFIPALLLTTLLVVAVYVIARYKNFPRLPRANSREIWTAFREAIWGLLLIPIVLGGIYGGVFTPTEAAAVAVVYSFLIAVFVYRELPLNQVARVVIDSSKIIIMLMFIVANAALFSYVMTGQRIPHMIAEGVLSAEMTHWQFLLLTNVILLIAGNIMEPTAVVLILAPILFFVGIRQGVDPTHLGIIMVVNTEIGMVTPPVGLNLYVTSAIAGMDIWSVIKAAMPWLFVLLGFLAIVTLVPQISTMLSNAVFGPEMVFVPKQQ